MARREVEHWVCGARAVEPLRAQLEHGLAVGEGVGAAAQPRRGLQQLHAGDEVGGERSLVTAHGAPEPGPAQLLRRAEPRHAATHHHAVAVNLRLHLAGCRYCRYYCRYQSHFIDSDIWMEH